jgi:hypothetical protein
MQKVRMCSVAILGGFVALQLLHGCAADVAENAENLGESQDALVCAGPFPPAATASLNAKQPASNAIDGNPGTRWESAFADSQQITIELPLQTSIAGVTLNWEAACGKDYDIDYATSASAPWQRFATIRGNTKSGVVTHLGSARKVKFVRMNGITRCTQYGFSLWEFSVNLAPKKCYLDADGDGYGNPATATETCNSVCPAGRIDTPFDCYDSNNKAYGGAPDYQKVNRGDGSFDYNCNGTIEVRSETGNVGLVCTDIVTHKKTSDCSRCEYKFVPIDATDCGQYRCSLGANEFILCK